MELDPDAAAQMAANAVLHYLRECSIEEAKRQAWIAKVFDLVRQRESN